MAHWLYPTQFFKTALILPEIFAELKIEWVEDDASDNQMRDMRLVDEEIAIHEGGVIHISLVAKFMSC